VIRAILNQEKKGNSQVRPKKAPRENKIVENLLSVWVGRRRRKERKKKRYSSLSWGGFSASFLLLSCFFF